MEILMLIYLSLYLGLSIFRPRLALLILFFTLPSYLIRFSLFDIPLTLLELQIIISFLVWLFNNFRYLIKNLKYRNKTNKYPFQNEIIFCLLAALLAVVISNFSTSSLGILKAYFIEPIMVYILVVNYFFKKNDWKKIVWSLTFSALSVSLLGIYQYITGNLIFNDFWAKAETRRIVSFFGYPNAVGLYLAPIFTLSLSLLINYLKRPRNKKNILNIITISLSMAASALTIYFAKSEGAIIALIIAIFLFLFFYTKKARLFVSITAIILLIIVTSNHTLFNTLKNKAYLQDKSGQIRLSQWSETWEMLNKEDLLISGAGLSNYQLRIKPYHAEGIFIKDYQDPKWLDKVMFNDEFRKQAWQPLEIYLYPHNIFLNFWVELGLLGLVIFLIIIIKYYYKTIFLLKKQKINKTLALGLIASLTTIIIHGLVDVPYFKNDLSVMFWLLVSILSINIIKYNHGKNSSNKSHSQL